ncbi:MAG: alkaline phosphatase family protein [Polyangiaceae bacterium]|jgi:phospholipase C
MAIPRRRFLGLGAGAAAAAVTGCGSRVVAGLRRPEIPFEAFDGKVEHFIVLMLENRSYDLMLGALAGEEHDGVPGGTTLQYEARDGLPAWVDVQYGAPPDAFSPDPGHGFQSVEAQIRGRGVDQPADMRGFAARFLHDHPSVSHAKMRDYLTLYGDGHLPILQTLAKEYGVCSHWFCSLPSSTAPNRMFAHAGTSGGVTRAGAYYSRIRGRMIFDRLGTADPRSWRVYFHDMPHLWLAGDAWTKTFSGHLQLIGGFARDVAADQLATYTFIEPQHIIPPWSSQHPSAGVCHGEKLIADLYNTLVSNPRVFEKSLFLIVYDEHGGFYDHVIPPGHPGWKEQCPGNDYVVLQPDDAFGSGRGREAGYAFDTLGPRVPAVVVSPWIDRGSVFGWKARDPARRATFDHTSILATVGAMTGVWVDSKRARAATNLGVTINRNDPRDDYPRSLRYDAGVYRPARVAENEPIDGEPDAGVAGELLDAWRAEHGEATPTEMVERYRELLGG